MDLTTLKTSMRKALCNTQERSTTPHPPNRKRVAQGGTGANDIYDWTEQNVDMSRTPSGRMGVDGGERCKPSYRKPKLESERGLGYIEQGLMGIYALQSSGGRDRKMVLNVGCGSGSASQVRYVDCATQVDEVYNQGREGEVVGKGDQPTGDNAVDPNLLAEFGYLARFENSTNLAGHENDNVETEDPYYDENGYGYGSIDAIIHTPLSNLLQSSRFINKARGEGERDSLEAMEKGDQENYGITTLDDEREEAARLEALRLEYEGLKELLRLKREAEERRKEEKHRREDERKKLEDTRRLEIEYEALKAVLERNENGRSKRKEMMEIKASEARVNRWANYRSATVESGSEDEDD